MNAAVAPVVVPLLTALLCVGLQARRTRWTVSLAGGGLSVLASLWLVALAHGHGVVVLRVGSWPAPYGIVFAADLLGALMSAIGSWVALWTLVALAAQPHPRLDAFFHAGWHLMLAGMNGAFLTGDLFNLYVFFEVLLVTSYFLVTLGATRRQAREAFTYVAVNIVASTILLMGVALLYAAVGSVNMADLAARIPQASPGLVRPAVFLLAVAFGVKAAVFPLYAWLPHTYAIPAGPVAAYFGGMLTKVGVYALYRLFTTLQPLHGPEPWLLAVAGLTMVLGVLGALAQEDMRRILSFHIVSQIGYMVFGLGLGTPQAWAAGIFYTLHNIAAKTALLLVSSAVEASYGTTSLRSLAGLAHAHPWLGVWFVVAALSLAGIPPLSGFWAKLLVVQAGLEAGEFAGVAVALAVSLVTLLSMLKIFTGAFWGPPPERSHISPLEHASVVGLAALTVAWGVGGGTLLELATAAARALGDPAGYVRAVLGGH
ncbi:MAG: proton-conducting transporter membrane subunit [Armatimonadota bacterium]|nr:Na+/H+ antiporter subunit D [Armatimonadota bacterium]MDW8156497.1 proton-conducting transporter membrane subunit [Armatimonadota bacterium]